MAKKNYNNKQERKPELRMFVIDITYADGHTHKVVINRRNFYEAKEEADAIRTEYNEKYTPKITGNFVKEVPKK
jgi:hypothetical protein